MMTIEPGSTRSRLATVSVVPMRKVLPSVLAQACVESYVLVGHSDGASIALIHAGDVGNAGPLRGVVAMAAHVMVEDCTIEGIAAARRAYVETDLRERLRR